MRHKWPPSKGPYIILNGQSASQFSKHNKLNQLGGVSMPFGANIKYYFYLVSHFCRFLVFFILRACGTVVAVLTTLVSVSVSVSV